jgi:hypothetical protein
MVISYYGRGMVKVTQGDTALVFNPIGEDKNFKPVRFGADMALVSQNDEAHNGVKNAARADRVPFVIDGPGEYEVSDILIRGVALPPVGGLNNTAYAVTFEEVNLVHLGNAGDEALSPAAVEALGEVDVLFLPVRAAKALTLLEPKLVVPIEYEDEAELKRFLKEAGLKESAPVESLALKRKDLASKQAEVVVIKSF